MKLKNIRELPSIFPDDNKGLRNFHQQLKGSVTYLNSVGYVSSLKSTDNVKIKPFYVYQSTLRMSFYKKFTAENFDEENINMIKLESWLGSIINSVFNPIASVIENELKSKLNNCKTSNFNTNHTSTDKASLGNKPIHNKTKHTCWLCKGHHKISNCDKSKENPVHMRSTLTKDINYVSIASLMIKY